MAKNNPYSPWPERDAEMRALRARGLSCTEIARRMGLTKDSITSRLCRLKRPGEPAEKETAA